ncbi:integrase [Streptosporangium sp. 'caverna']|uniref:integrase n=1 Tax=Streptosporangium sp. 'caverna' TaxID=2202249 RepID=UPI000D7E00B1|nr:integrase [Streptosporangium sp. 'caverna']AWS45909.1 integrase [Streptosporangium sp. 'caverna']
MRLTLATEPAYPDRPNEDFIGATPDAIVLLDGAGTPADLKSGCSHGVAWYSHTLGSTLLAGMTQSADSLTTTLAAGIKATASMHDFCCDLSHPGSPSATVVMLRRTADTLDWLVLADSVLVLDLLDADPMVICDEREALTGNRYRGPMNAAAGGSPEHLQALSRYMEAMRAHRNVDGGFWVASVDPLAAEQALTGTVPAALVRATAILSDGASRLVDRFGLATWRRALDLLDDSGPEELIRQVRLAEHSDPGGERWPRGKTFDDATAAYLVLP